MNIHFGLLPAMEMGKRVSKSEKQQLISERALNSISSNNWRVGGAS
jgi:folate-dependent tRNA-U54 methylase TrmFO/GidA